MDQSIRLRRPADDIADRTKAMREIQEAANSTLRMMQKLQRTTAAPTTDDAEADHGKR